MSIRACSYVDETYIGTPKQLFKQFERLGVYRWKNVMDAANNDLAKMVLAFRFSRTELFSTPVTLAEYMKITGRNSAPLSPSLISRSIFKVLYMIGRS